MRLGILGAGRIGVMHARNAAASAAVGDLTVFDADPLRAAAVASEVGASAAGSVEEVLGRVDGVLVATPSPTHAEVVHRAVAAGVPVLCEKPLALEPAVVEELAAAADARGVPVVVGFQRRFDPALLAVRASIASGACGPVHLVRAVAMDHRPPPLEYVATSGGIYVDQLVHDLDALPWLLGQAVVRVQATGAVVVDPGFAAVGDVDTAVVVLTFASGALGVISAGRSNGGGYDNRIEVSAERASLAVGLDDRTPLTSLEAGTTPPADPHLDFMSRHATAYRAELEAFARIVTEGAPNPSPPRDGLLALELAAACRASSEQGRAVDLAPAPAH